MLVAKGGTLILGGGFGGAHVARLLPEATIVSPESSMLYTPLLPEVAAGAVEPRHVLVPLRMMCPRAELLRGRVSALDEVARTVAVETEIGDVEVSYRRLVIALGSTARILPIPGLAEHAMTFKDLADAVHLRNHVIPPLLETLGAAEILARGPKSVGALRRHGLRELWASDSECFDDVLAHLRGRDLTGLRIVVQEHGQSLSMVAHALRRQGADVTTVTVYRVESAVDPEPVFRLIDLVADRALDAVTFTSAPAVAALMDAAASTGRRDELITAFQADVVASCVGPVTSAAFEMWGAPTMVKQLETELPMRSFGTTFEVAGHTLLVHGETVLVDGVEAKLSPAPFALLQAMLVNPGHVVSRRELLAALPSGTAGSEHAVEMAVARLRAALGTRTVQTVVKRGYRLAVALA